LGKRFIWAVMLLPGLLVLRTTKGRKQRRVSDLLAAVLLLAGVIAGCQGLTTPSNHGSFAVTVTGTSAEVQTSSTINLTLN
jgi:hypothetical protein